MCSLCRHLSGFPGATVCAAFPGGIPDAIVQFRFDHRRPWIDPETGQPGDQGIPLNGPITFEPAEGVRLSALAALYEKLDALPRR